MSRWWDNSRVTVEFDIGLSTSVTIITVALIVAMLVGGAINKIVGAM